MISSASFGDLGKLAEFEKSIEKLSGDEKCREMKKFFNGLEEPQLAELLPKASEEYLCAYFIVYRARVEHALNSMTDPLQKGKKYYNIATSLPVKMKDIAKELLSKCLVCARDALRAAKTPDDLKAAHYFLAQIYGSKGNLDKAIQEAKRAAKIEGADVTAVEFYEIGKLHQLRGEEDDKGSAKKFFEKALAVDPTFQHAAYQIAKILEKEGNLDTALQTLRTVEALLDELEPGLYNEMGSLYKKKHETIQDTIFENDEAIAKLKNEMGETSSEVQDLLREYEELVSRYETSNGLTGDPEGPLPSRRRYNDEKIDILSDSLSKKKETIPGSGMNPVVAELVRRYEESLQIYREMINRGENNRYHAIHYFRKALQQQRPFQASHVNLAKVYLGMARFQLCFREYQSAIDAGINIARLYLGRLYIYLDNHHQNIPEGKKLLEDFIRIAEATKDPLSLAQLEEARKILAEVNER